MVRSELKRTVCGAVALTAVATSVGVSSGPALAQPSTPNTLSEAQRQLRDLSRNAELLTEEYKKAQDDHAARKADLDRATTEADTAQRVADQARMEEERFRGEVDQLTSASYQGARVNQLSALLVSESPDDFLDRASVLEVLAKDNNEAISRLADATHQAEDAQRRAQDARGRAARAEADAARITGEIAAKKGAMDGEVARVKQQYDQLSPAEQDSLSGESSNVGSIAGAGAAVQAVNAALGKQGSPYVFGAKGPSQFDCSGLVQWSYKQAGVEVPGSTKSQVSEGRGVSRSDLRPGDVVFYYSSASHNAMYIGGGKVVHAPTEGQDVTVEQLDDIGDVNSIRRFVG
ncbi:C40 family peptidase [Saccharopolyspora erythraea]|uniref:C40 family peptidase n=1 Tax=Saccharopolyspora erythraea TaxID=1836 RepID=UPI001BA7C1AF|nr:C40 family peptidase [Saccharopolyspora erythraea]QUH03915.1 C40 family peptidase [Saccharopolyspora erythraea]